MGNVSSGWLLVSSLLSGLVAVVVTLCVGAWRDRRKLKKDVLRRLVGHRYIFTDDFHSELPPSGEPFVALNEAIVVFANDKEVLDALVQVRTTGGGGEQLTALIKRMASAAGVEFRFDDAIFVRPLTPGPGLQGTRREDGSPAASIRRQQALSGDMED